MCSVFDSSLMGPIEIAGVRSGIVAFFHERSPRMGRASAPAVRSRDVRLIEFIPGRDSSPARLGRTRTGIQPSALKNAGFPDVILADDQIDTPQALDFALPEGLRNCRISRLGKTSWLVMKFGSFGINWAILIDHEIVARREGKEPCGPFSE